MDAQLREGEKKRIDVSKVSPELDFDVIQLGLSGDVKLVTGTSSSPRILPTNTLPLGLPPVYPDLKSEIEEFLISPQDIPIHAFQTAQQYWQREKDLESLMDTNLSPCPSELAMERDPKTGKLQSHHEVFKGEVGLNAQNSMSLKRKPGAFTDSVKGESSNCPFWPGGMDLPTLEKFTKSNIKDDVLELSKDKLLIRPPGFDFDVTLNNEIYSLPGLSSGSDKQTISITDILSVDMDLAALYIDVSEKDIAVTQQESPVDVTFSVKEEIPDQILQVNEPEGSLKPKANEKKQWAILDNSDVKDFHRQVPDMAFKYPFELDSFQKRAILHLERHENVLVAAHTSAGKTVVAEYSIALAQKHMRRAIYTSPIKALSNQKFRDFKNTFPEVGLLTGDVQIKPESSCLIMTTEILRSMLYNGSDVIRDVEWVIFDEIHYINDIDRGVVWEEVLIMLPSHVGIILLSATVPNTLEFASWIGKTKKKEVYVVQTKKRPVPLEHYLYTGNSNKTSNELFCILDQKGKFIIEGYRAAVQAKKERASKADENYGPKGIRQGNPKLDRNIWLSVVQMLKKKDQLPVVAFTLSKKKCDANADMVKSIDLVSSTERSHITMFFNKSISKLKGDDQSLPQVLWMKELLKNGIGVHHSGVLPILKEVVEMLFQKSLLKILFATETFAIGVNMPARTVVFDSTRKFDGNKFRELLSSEYIQMAGRAGRRGLDSTGMVIMLCKGDVPETSDLHKMLLGTPTKLVSRFRLTYYMILNLLRVKQLTVQDMMKRSFAEFYLQKDAPENEKKLEELRLQTKHLQEPNCALCSIDLKKYYLTWAEIFQLKKIVKSAIFSSPYGIKCMTPGRVVVVSNGKHRNALGVVLMDGGLESKFSSSSSVKEPLQRVYTVLILCNKDHEQETVVTTGEKSHKEMFLSNKLFLPQEQSGQIVEEIAVADIESIINRLLKIDFAKIIDNHKKRLIPRFKNDPPSQSTIMAGQDLLNLAQEFQTSIPLINPVKDLNLNNIDFIENLKRLEKLESNMLTYSCLECTSFSEHFNLMRANMKVREDVSQLELRLSDESLELIEEYNQRIEVLKELNYVDKDKNLQHKGRVAFEVSTEGMMITELLINNILTELHPEEIVAVLSCFVFEQKNASPPTLNDNLQKVVNLVKETAKRVAICQKQCGLDVTVEECVGELHFGLVEVIYEWARGMSFKEVMNLTDVSEGNIVRCIQRLDETLRDVRKAAHVIGVETLCDKMEKGMSLIRRDIVFAASLYTT
ncbi:SKI2 subunit of superkiller complex protein-like [Hydractinia symbiolongicarpus]|uniref:SKI2 subunit of superkiller complex protein-like n=1 Tax=Hydractinia symbiolongicarpus TaxID=13093 RepID=UPI00254A794B|nr:SKI2 subunit of superkiller complex protein-like [Hydractinia symbiolongicarpus]